jgi:hypothetical protein
VNESLGSRLQHARWSNEEGLALLDIAFGEVLFLRAMFGDVVLFVQMQPTTT